jgi:hypothetical protein
VNTHPASLLSSIIVMLASALGRAQEPLLPRAEMQGLERAAAELARAGQREAWEDLVVVLRELGMPMKDATTLQTVGERELTKRKKPAEPVPRTAKALASEAARLAAGLPARPPDVANRLAAALLRIDSDLALAQQQLGRELGASGWEAAGVTARDQRRVARHDALRQIRRLPIATTTSEVSGDDPFGHGGGDAGRLVATLDLPFTCVKAGALTVVSTGSAAETTRIVSQSLRALAFVEFALSDEVASPKPAAWRVAIVESKTDYDRTIAAAVQRGWLPAERGPEARAMSGFFLRDGSLVDLAQTETEASAALLVRLTTEILPDAVLQAGMCNWSARALLGAAVPSFAWVEAAESRAAASARTQSQDLRLQALRSELLRVAEAGLAGGRAYLRFLAAQREDPPWSAAMVPEFGRIVGEPLLKATFVCEYFMDEGSLAEVQRTAANTIGGSIADRFTKAVGIPLTDFERRFRDWIVGNEPGLVQRLSVVRTEISKDAQSTLAELERVRTAAFGASSAIVRDVKSLVLDAESSAGCAAHARYLATYPERAALWPDAHEENCEHPEWSANGAWAGANSVIAPGVDSGVAAITAFMGTFYHRLPLLDAGLVRVGYAHERGMAVLDSGSFVAPRATPWHVAWPPDGAVDVPLRFCSELPNPVPGQDQSKFGYPITLQGAIERAVQVTMRLREGSREGREVPCWFSSPTTPTNPELAPRGAFCLIPKAPLRPATRYTVVVTWPPEAELVWSWRTR